jgi:predicted O-methyltransferase YrrM
MAPDSQPNREIALARLRAVLDEVVQEGTATARTDGSVHRVFPVAVGPAEGAVIRSWVIREHASRTVEVGLGYGISALFACEGLLTASAAGARHVVIDPHQDTRFAAVGLQILGEAGVSGLVEFHAGESQLVLPRLLAQGRQFDLAIVDGNHRFDAVFVDLYYLGRLLRAGGIVFLDDYQLPGVARAAAFFTANLSWRLEETGTAGEHHHWAVLRTSTGPDTRSFDYLAGF